MTCTCGRAQVVAVAEALNKVDVETNDIIPFVEDDCDTLMALVMDYYSS